MRKENLPIIIGITLPLALIAVIAAVIFIPASLTEPPETDLIMVDNNYAYGAGHYEVRGNALVLVEDPVPPNDPYYRKGNPPQLYRYDVETDRMTVITEAEAKKLRLDPSPTSPDGFSLDHGGGNGGVFPFFFFDDGNQGLYLRKGAYAQQMSTPAAYDMWRYQFLGWVIE